MKLRFEIVAHKNQRYPSCGDYFLKKGVWWFRVSRLKKKEYVSLVFIHEVIEWNLCQLWGVKVRKIDRFDIAYEAARARGEKRAPCGCQTHDEPGDDIHAPYHDAHAIATQCEMLIAKALDVDWLEYEDAVESL